MADQEKETHELSRADIEVLLPYRDKMLLLDKAVIVDVPFYNYPGLDGRFTNGEYFIDPESVFMNGHFPGFKIFPGFLTAEVMAQTAALHFAYFNKDLVGKRFVLAAANNLVWKRPVFPNSRLLTTAQYGKQQTKKHGRVFIDFDVQADVVSGDGQRKLAATGTITGCIL